MDLRSMFSFQAQVRRLTSLPELSTVVMDEVFKDRPQHAMAVVNAQDIKRRVRTMPVIRRGAPSLAMPAEGSSISAYEPLPIAINDTVTPTEVNNLKLIGEQGVEAWATQKTDSLRRTVRQTTEGIAAQALNGKVSWPIQLSGGGHDVYEVNWGNPVAVAAPKKWDAAGASLADVVKTLTSMRKALRRKGFGGGVIKYWAGEDAFDALVRLAEVYEGDAIRLEIKDGSLLVGAAEIILRAEEYPDPVEANKWNPVQPSTQLRAIDPQGGHLMPYCALDDFDAKLAPLPLFIKPIRQDDPSGYKLVAQSKPFPVPNMDAVAVCSVAG